MNATVTFNFRTGDNVVVLKTYKDYFVEGDDKDTLLNKIYNNIEQIKNRWNGTLTYYIDVYKTTSIYTEIGGKEVCM